MRQGKLKTLTMVMAVLVVLFTVPAFAAVPEMDSGIVAGGPKMVLGLGAAAVPDYEGSDDYTGAPVLLFQYHFQSGRYIDLLANRVKVNLVGSRNFQLGPVLQYRATRDDDVEDDQVKLMQKVDAAVEAGLFAGIDINNWMASVQVTQDVSSAHEGTLATATGGYRINFNPSFTLVPTLSATWASDDYMETYFGVNGNNRGSSTLPNYTADGGLKDITLMFLADIHPWQNWKIVSGVGFKSLLGDAEDSPVVDQRGDSSQMVAAVILAYQWGR